MDNINQTGKKLAKIQKESNTNIRRAAENFPLPERIVDSFNPAHPYETTFATTANSTVYLSLKIVEFPTPCSVNPPYVDVRCVTNFGGDNPGQIGAIISTTYNVDKINNPPNPDFVLVSQSTGTWRTGVTVPLDGCYSVLWQSSAWGVGYVPGKPITVGITKNDTVVRTVWQTNTWELHLLGPTIYSYAPASPVWATVECKAGDVISAFLTEQDVAESIPWYNGTGLSGFFYSPYSDSSLTIELIAVAEEQP